MPRSRLACRAALLGALVGLLAALPAAAQLITFPRLGASAAPDQQVATIEVHGDDVFQLHVLVMPPEGETALAQDFRQFEWVLLEPCCGGAATVLEMDLNPAFAHEGNLLGGMTSTLEDGQPCASGEVIRLATLTLQMEGDVSPGVYFILAGPFGLAYDCAGEGVVMTDMQLAVDYTPDITPTASRSLSDIKALYR